jgi:hypothetical protein
MAIGLGLIFLFAPLKSMRQRRWTDFLPRGRRVGDRSWFGRRNTDAASLPRGEDRRGVNVVKGERVREEA